MTEEERQGLCKRLRSIAEENWWADACDAAAEEIERLQERCERLRKEMVKWRDRCVPQENGND
jgi:hypothetical protein